MRFSVSKLLVCISKGTMNENFWRDILDILEKKLTKYQFNTFFKDTKQVNFKDNKLTIQVPSKFHHDYIKTKYYKDVQSLINSISDEKLSLLIEFKPGIISYSPEDKKKTVSKKPFKKSNKKSFLDKYYTFNNFIVGDSNRLAHAACIAVAKNPARAYNPLFIYGGVGLGKTHLLQAIGNYLLNKQPQLTVKYITFDDFANDFVDSIRNNTLSSFRIRYRGSDILLIDDIEFIAGKEGMQEHFFHTFNKLHQSGKQIVITSDRPPKDISTLNDRLRSRFESGFLTDIKLPDLETREAILRKIVEKEKIEIPNEILHFIANKIKYNIRDMQGALRTLIGITNLTSEIIDIKTTKKVLSDFQKSNLKRDISLKDITEKVAEYFNLTAKDLKSRLRSNTIAFPRQVCMYIAREITDFSTTDIGREFGKDHTTTIYGHNKIKKLRSSDSFLDEKIDSIISELRGY